MLSISPLLIAWVLAVPPPPFGDARHPVTREVARVHSASAPRGASMGATTDSHFLGVAYRFYQTVVTPMDGPRCSHRPTCSAYARQAIARHGLVGLWLTYDRLLRDARSSQVRPLPVALEHGRLVYLDPLEESTFWLP
ncbi:membrane protein insertion efficiency factor YidD [Stigmatella sp. ncwal1]|uniref:Membrane protein insertion efficiency factor YidD n=1 Tax=Stigmatella ashevillensis TaxID=2995309 RepID=A0ABT5DCJ9_9BACT|nr:membrane protein insertion efficiency factor YidD [Stigmatella ashevillena]MDC0711402.1 membrane protein insertion efficiency factor YidD [Stigmatella ashevillena]